MHPEGINSLQEALSKKKQDEHFLNKVQKSDKEEKLRKKV